MLKAACEYHNCLPASKKRQSPGDYAKALKKAGVLDCSLVNEVINVGNRCAHYRIVNYYELHGAIDLAYWIADSIVETDGVIGALREGGAV